MTFIWLCPAWINILCSQFSLWKVKVILQGLLAFSYVGWRLGRLIQDYWVSDFSITKTIWTYSHWTYICPTSLLESAQNTSFFTFLCFSNSRSVISDEIWPCTHPFLLLHCIQGHFRYSYIVLNKLRIVQCALEFNDKDTQTWHSLLIG